jgi:phage-related protein
MKKVEWMGGCLKDLKRFPKEVREEVGFTLFLAQQGDTAVNAVPLLGFGGANVLEVVIDESGSTFRAVYTVRFEEAVYALHAFQKKSKRGVATPKRDMDLIRSRLKLAQAHYSRHYAKAKKRDLAG